MAKCLIADDSKVIRMILSKIMSNLKYDIIEAEDGEEVVELCETEEPDLIIMDTKLPILEGLDAMYKIVRRGNYFKQAGNLEFSVGCLHEKRRF